VNKNKINRKVLELLIKAELTQFQPPKPLVSIDQFWLDLTNGMKLPV